MELTKEIAYREVADFFSNDKPFVLFGTGTSCALDLAFGMPALEAFLRTRLSSGLTEMQVEQWQKVVGALDNATHDFESAMDFIKDDALTNKVVELTAEFISENDLAYSHKIISGISVWPAGILFRKLVSALPELDRRLHVATPNYDLLAEYSFVRNGIPYITGFHGGYCRSYGWAEATKSVSQIKSIPFRGKMQTRSQEQKHIRLHKPHGSLNRFEVENRLVECDGWIREKPDLAIRAMITPGTAKYQKLHQDRAQLADYDRAANSHTRFLFLGFGFNDSQLVNNVFKQKLEHDNCPALVITRDLNARIMDWINKCPNMWIVCKQESNNNTRVYNAKFNDWLVIDDKELWRFDQFTKEFLGD